MSDSVAITVQHDGEERVRFPDENVACSLDLTPVGPRQFRIASIPIMVESATFGDIIEAERLPDGTLEFERVFEAGQWRVFSFVLPQVSLGSSEIAVVKARVLGHDGHWEEIFGGLLFLCLPPGCDYDPTSDILS